MQHSIYKCVVCFDVRYMSFRKLLLPFIKTRLEKTQELSIICTIFFGFHLAQTSSNFTTLVSRPEYERIDPSSAIALSFFLAYWLICNLRHIMPFLNKTRVHVVNFLVPSYLLGKGKEVGRWYNTTADDRQKQWHVADTIL